MPADATTSSPNVPDLQRRIDELSAELHARTAERDEAAQREAAVAMENSRLMAETREALERQEATSEVLGVISGSPEELEPVFRSILSNAIVLCRADLGNLFLYDGNAFRVAAMRGASPAYEEAWRRHPVLSVADHPDVPLARLAATKQVVHIHDLAPERSQLERDPRYAALLDAARARTMLLVPMLKDGELIGAIVIYTSEVRPFDDKHIDLVVNFARQAVIAIENSRLLKQLRDRTRDLGESFDYQSATGEVLNVISRSPTDTQPVFEAIAESTARLCQAEFCHVYRFDGELIHFMAGYGHSSEADQAIRRRYPIPPGRGSCAARAILSGAVELVPDIGADPDYAHGNVADIMKANSIVAVPMLREGRPVGAIALLRAAPGSFPQRQIELLQTFADQAVIAINNVRMFDEVQARAFPRRLSSRRRRPSYCRSSTPRRAISRRCSTRCSSVPCG